MSTAKNNIQLDAFSSVVHLPDVLLPQKVRLQSLPPPSNARFIANMTTAGRPINKKVNPYSRRPSNSHPRARVWVSPLASVFTLDRSLRASFRANRLVKSDSRHSRTLNVALKQRKVLRFGIIIPTGVVGFGGQSLSKTKLSPNRSVFPRILDRPSRQTDDANAFQHYPERNTPVPRRPMVHRRGDVVGDVFNGL